MDRRRLLLVVAIVVAMLGTGLVYLYARGADQRAESRFETVEVLRATQPIASGESIEDAASAGKIALQPVVRDYVLDGAQSSLDTLAGQFATTEINPGEQIVTSKFGASAEVEAAPSSLPIPDAQVAVSVNLTDTARVAGFVNPGSKVAIYLSTVDSTRMLLERVTVIGVGSTTPTYAATTTAEGAVAETAETLPRTLMTLALDQRDAEKVMFAQSTGELAFALLTEKSKISAGPGANIANLFQ